MLSSITAPISSVSSPQVNPVDGNDRCTGRGCIFDSNGWPNDTCLADFARAIYGGGVRCSRTVQNLHALSEQAIFITVCGLETCRTGSRSVSHLWKTVDYKCSLCRGTVSRKINGFDIRRNMQGYGVFIFNFGILESQIAISNVFVKNHLK